MPASGRRLEATLRWLSAPQVVGSLAVKPHVLLGGVHFQFPQTVSGPPAEEGMPNQLIENMMARWGTMAICWARSKVCATVTAPERGAARDGPPRGASPVPQDRAAMKRNAGTQREARPDAGGTDRPPP